MNIETCGDQRMNLKSKFTTAMYKNGQIKDTVHSKCLQWINSITKSLYESLNIKSIIMRFISTSPNALLELAEKSFELIQLQHDMKERKLGLISSRYQQAVSSASTELLFSDTLIYDIFFMMYMKGGMATRYLCLYLNSITKSVVYDKDTLLQNLGDVSDYDFNMIINPELPQNYFEELQKEIHSVVNFEMSSISKNDEFFTSSTIIEEFLRMAREIIATTPNLAQTMCVTKTTQNIGKQSFTDLQSFSLSRLMTVVGTKCQGGICIRDNGSLKSEANLLAELIDVSYPNYSMFAERVHAWKYANNAILVSFCDLKYDMCSIPTTLSKEGIIRFNSLDDIIDDIQITIKGSIERGDFSKVEKRKKRLKFLGELVCNYEILKNKIYGGSFEEGLFKKCQDAVKSMICKNQYINKDVGFYISNLAIGLKIDEFIIYRIVRQYILEITKHLVFQKSAIMYNGTVTYMDIIEYTARKYEEYLSTTPNNTLLALRDRVCKLVVNAISLVLSFSEVYLKQFIAQLFLKNILQFISGDYSGIDTFDKTVIIERENIYNLFNRPFVRDNIKTILDALLQSCEMTCTSTTLIRVEDDVACHYNIYKTLTDLVCEKISATIFSPVSCNLILETLTGLLKPLLALYSETQSVVFRHELTPDEYGEYVYRLTVEYSNVFFQRDVFYISNIAFQNTSFTTKHTILEIRMNNTMPSDDTVIYMSSKSEKVKLGFTSKSSLLQQYNVLTEQSIHWYVKSGYMRRITALNGILTNPELRTLYDSEFPPLSKQEDPEWLKQIPPPSIPIPLTSEEILDYINKVQSYYMAHFPRELTSSITWYTGSNYRALNKSLRRKIQLTPEQIYNSRNIDYLFSIVRPIGYSVILYRGVDSDIGTFELQGEIKDDAYISATNDISVALDFANFEKKCCLLVIYVPPTAKILSTQAFSLIHQEKEFILQRNASFIIRKIEHDANLNMRIIYVDYLYENL